MLFRNILKRYWFYSTIDPKYFWIRNPGVSSNMIYWTASTEIGPFSGEDITSYTTGGYTYYRGEGPIMYSAPYYYYRVRRVVS